MLEALAFSPARHVLVCGLNPSTADERREDPSSRQIIAFAKREGGTRLTLVKLYAARMTDPRRLREFRDPVGPENDRTIVPGRRERRPGDRGMGKPASKTGVERAAEVLRMLRSRGDMHRLGEATTKGSFVAPAVPAGRRGANTLELHAAAIHQGRSCGSRETRRATREA